LSFNSLFYSLGATSCRTSLCALTKKTTARDPVPPPQVASPRRKPRGQPLPPDDLRFNRAFASVRISVEHTTRDLRIDQSLSQVDRHRR